MSCYDIEFKEANGVENPRLQHVGMSIQPKALGKSGNSRMGNTLRSAVITFSILFSLWSWSGQKAGPRRSARGSGGHADIAEYCTILLQSPQDCCGDHCAPIHCNERLRYRTSTVCSLVDHKTSCEPVSVAQKSYRILSDLRSRPGCCSSTFSTDALVYSLVTCSRRSHMIMARSSKTTVCFGK